MTATGLGTLACYAKRWLYGVVDDDDGKREILNHQASTPRLPCLSTFHLLFLGEIVNMTFFLSLSEESPGN